LTMVLLGLSTVSLFWLQPLTPVRNLDFWFPISSIALTVFVWAATYPERSRPLRRYLPGLSILFLVTVGIAATRFFEPLCCISAARPPQMPTVLAALGAILAIGSFIYIFPSTNKVPLLIAVIVLMLLFIILKHDELARLSSSYLRRWSGQSGDLATSGDLLWLGFSFLAFRLLHVARDRQANRLPAYSLAEFASYTLFFPALISGPIDRAQHFIGEVRSLSADPKDQDWKNKARRDSQQGLQRILIGAFKKMVLADSLAYFALNEQNAQQTSSTGLAWVILFAFSLRIYLDFSGYTDIAIGIARLMGINLPENFDRPYLKTNLTSFWNSWHMTLAQWFRSYVYYPFTRFLRSKEKPIPTWTVILAGQFLTMSLIGLWHGITWNFFIWGVWHALGLFIQNRWSEWTRLKLDSATIGSGARGLMFLSSWLVTFLFVTLGWVWFVLPSPKLALLVFSALIGVRP
jgi:alginate O-acetyltransferase complex protein AlgI